MHGSTSEQRNSRRKSLLAPVRYRYPNMTSPDDGVLANISSSGLMLWTARDFCPAGELTIWLPSTHERFPAIQVSARVVRTEPTYDRQFAFGFGCKIVEEVVDDLAQITNR